MNHDGATDFGFLEMLSDFQWSPSADCSHPGQRGDCIWRFNFDWNAFMTDSATPNSSTADSPNSNRRDFGKAIAAGTAAWLAGGRQTRGDEPAVDAITQPTPPVVYLQSSPDDPEPPHVRTEGIVSDDGQVFHESARNVPVVRSADVIVCGGGPAGFAAALAAARSGAKTLLIDVAGCIGGVWTAGALSLIIDSKGKPGIMAELQGQMARHSSGHWIGSSIVYDPEAMKYLLETTLLEAGVSIRLHTRVVGAVTDPNGRLSTIVTESKSGREAWTAKTFIDCTGDGDLAAQAGCQFELGHAETKATQPMSLMALFTGVETDDIAQFIRGDAEPRKLGNPKANLLAEFRKAGIDPSYGGPTIFRIRDGLYAMMANHQYAALSINADDVTAATLQARGEVNRLIWSLRKLGGIWSGLQLVATAEQIGTREGRRIRGRYHVTADDLRRGARFDDAICRVNFGIDVHSTNPKNTKAIEAKPFRSQPYDIPLRALIARDVTGLMMAGRCISGDFIAHSSYRVTGDAVTMGEAAGVTSALAASVSTTPDAVPFTEVARALQGVRNDAAGRVSAVRS